MAPLLCYIFEVAGGNFCLYKVCATLPHGFLKGMDA
jgi:hypothetical protein